MQAGGGEGEGGGGGGRASGERRRRGGEGRLFFVDLQGFVPEIVKPWELFLSKK